MKRKLESDKLTCKCCKCVRPSSDFNKDSLSRLREDEMNSQVTCSLCTALKFTLASPQTKGKVGRLDDPSTEFIRNPAAAPVVQSSRSFFKSFKRLDYKVHVGRVAGWRTQAKLCVRRTASSPVVIGLFRPGSHSIVPCMESRAHHPSINAMAHVVLTACRLCGVDGYSEDRDSGLLRYLVMSVESGTGRVQVSLIWNESAVSESLREVARVIHSIACAVDDKARLHSVWANLHKTSRHDNAITGREEGSWVFLEGSRSSPEEVIATNMTAAPHPTLFFPHTVFRQANIEGFARIVREIRRWVPRKGVCVELYAGVGTIGLNLIDLVEKIHCSDENPHNKRCFEDSLALLPLELRGKASYSTMSAVAVVQRFGLSECDYVIVDPPRKGLDDEVVTALISGFSSDAPLQRLIYVSCGFKAFQRDCTALLTSGCWTLIHAEGHVLFPGADHVETLAIFDRAFNGE